MNTADEVLRAIYHVLNQKMHFVGNTLVRLSKEKIIEQKINAFGDFYESTAYFVTRKTNSIGMVIGSNVKHEPYVLGGKVPSWTPLAPIKAWVERKGLAWVDKKTKMELTVEQMAWMIIRKIKQKGIPARNVFADVLKNEKDWIISQFNNIQVSI